MYPNLYYVFKDLFGVEWPALRFINSFGFFVAISFLVAAALLARELRRKSKQGVFQPTEVKVTVGRPATASELVSNFLLGFLLGYKILALFFLSSEYTQDPQAFIFSTMGNWPLGLALGGLFAFLKWREKKKNQLEKPEERTVRLWPQDRVGEFTILALVFGLVGAKLFDIFENLDEFSKDPIGTIFSGGGLTFYGGLILATLAIIWYARKHKISVRHLGDAIAPSLMIAYAIGRIGCQVAGDGDWGIFNSAYASTPTGEVVVSDPANFQSTVNTNTDYFTKFLVSSGIDSIPSKAVTKPGALSFLPDWMFAYNFPRNVNEVGVKLVGCEGKYCHHLPAPVFPTAFYETMICLVLFLVLWLVRKRIKIAGTLFAVYLVLNGLERFTIEQIRVNNRMNFLGMEPSQAEIIAVILMLIGIGLWIFLQQKYRARPAKV
jgi:phosphatidylglycerol---prolipoprotein diacylglyceryl transferase